MRPGICPSRPERANLRELVVSVCRVFEGLARQKRLLWHIELDAHSDVDVLIDPTRFKQVLSNLLSNAIKFTEDGRGESAAGGDRRRRPSDWR